MSPSTGGYVSGPRGAPSLWTTGALILLLQGCGGGSPDTITSETFIDTYVDLREAALSTDSLRLATADRERVLAEHGVTEADLEAFVEVHATELEYMRDVWNEVETRLDREVEPR